MIDMIENGSFGLAIVGLELNQSGLATFVAFTQHVMIGHCCEKRRSGEISDVLINVTWMLSDRWRVAGEMDEQSFHTKKASYTHQPFLIVFEGDIQHWSLNRSSLRSLVFEHDGKDL